MNFETRGIAHPHDHAVCTYGNPEGLRDAAVAFLKAGIEAGEVVVVVHSFDSDAEAWSFLEAGFPGVSRLAEETLVLVSLYELAFERDGRIHYEHVAEVVAGLREGAARIGRGLRIFVDASRRYLSSGRSDEWFAFEGWLGRRLKDDVSLVCAYPRDLMADPRFLEAILLTHEYRFVPLGVSTD